MGIYFPIILIAYANIQGALSTECVEVDRPKTRIFPSLVAFQGNKVPFDPRNSSEGNYVSFGLRVVENLPKNAFLTFDSEHIIKLDLNGKSIRRISDNAFFSLSCLKYLTINNNSLSVLTWKTFDGIQNLKELELIGNKLTELPDKAFTMMTRLKYLDLSDNILYRISPFSFDNLSSLHYLKLGKNRLVYIQPEVFNPLVSLRTIDLSFNKFIDSGSEKWVLPNLEILNLSGNFLRNFDTSLNFSFRSLQKLNLSSNYLTKLNVHSLKVNFQKLTVIDLNHNYWHCDDLASMLHYLIDNRLRIPSRNTTQINEMGIDCENTTQIPFDFSETTTVAIPSSSIIAMNVTALNELKIEHQIRNLSMKNDEILLEISGVRKLLIFCLLFLLFL
ncbi:hypothetical protein HHI36_007640 [Cryptolaemus montrouzieri]|uniref:Uncharacterized protein n=1 Tax=Cryptolaemus montrouzieri TaxID=559131 RepID=A0ABD2MQ41_9CUCU